MNRNFKVIWNEALGCFTAVAEYAKARGKSSKSSVSANASINTSASLSSVNTLRLSTIGLGLLAAGLTIPAAANGYYYYYPSGMNFAGDDATPKVYISTTYRNQTLKVQGDETVAGDSNTKNISVAANSSDKSLTVKLDEDVNLGTDGSLKIGDTLVDSSGIMVKAIDPNNNVVLSNSGLNNGNNRIINVEDGIGPKDAVNVSQLDSSIAENKVKYYSVNSDGGTNDLNEGATGQNAMAMGRNARAIGSQTIAIGSASSGQDTIAKGAQSIAIGANVVSIGASSIAIGGDDLDLASKYNIDGSDIAAALNSGTVNTVFNEYAGRDLLDPNNRFAGYTQTLGAASIAIGAKSRSNGHLATAVGIHSDASGTASSAFGIAATASEKGASALGSGANASAVNGVALGSKSVANIAGGAGTEGFVPAGATLADQNIITSTRSESLGAVSVGNDTDGNRQIVKVAAGKNNSDAVNVAQLKGLSNVVDLGLNFGADSGNTVKRELGQTFNINGDSKNISTVTTANGVNVQMSDTPTFTKVTLIDAPTVGTDATNKTYVDGTRTQVTSNNNSISVSETASGDARVFDLSVDAQSLSESAQSPVVYTDATGNKLYKQTDGSFNTNPDGSGDLVTAIDVIASMQSATGSTSTPTTLSNIAAGSLASDSTDAVNGSQLYTTNQNVSTNEGNITTNRDNIAKGIKFNVNDSLQKTFDLGEEIKLNTDNNLTTTLLSTNDGIELGLAPNLTGLISADFGGVNISTEGIDLNNNQITGLGSAGDITLATNEKNAVNAGDLNNAVGGVTSLGFALRAADTNEVQRNLGDAVDIVGSNNNITTQVIDDKIAIKLNNNLNLGALGTVKTGGNVILNTVVTPLGVSVTGLNPLNPVTLTAAGLNNAGKKIINVKDGAVTSSSQDAVNGSQLYTTNQNVSTNEGNITTNRDNIAKGIKFNVNDSLQKTFDLGEEIKLNTDNNLTTTLLSTNDGIELGLADVITVGSDMPVMIDGTNGTVSGLSNTTFDANQTYTGGLAATQEQLLEVNNSINQTVDRGLDFTGDNTLVTVTRKMGEKLTIKGGEVDADRLASGNNIGVIANDTDNSLTVKLAKDLTDLNSANFGSGVSISANGLNNGSNKITNVADGSTPKDAVNFGQLSDTNTKVDINTTDIETNTTDIGVNTGNIAKGIRIGDGDSTNDQQFALGDTINVTGDSNILTTASATGVQIQLNNQLDLSEDGSIRIGNSIMNNSGFTFVSSDTNRTVRLSSMGLNNGGNVISNVGRGVELTDGVNLGQLQEATSVVNAGWELSAQGNNASTVRPGSSVDLNNTDGNIVVSKTEDNNDITFNLNDEINVKNISTGDSTMTSNGLVIADGPSVTKTGINAANMRVTNVQNGEVSSSSQDAINGSQLFAQGTGISSIIGGNTVYNAEDGSFTNTNIGGTGESSIDGAIASIKQGEIVINENIANNATNIETNTTNIANNTSNIATNTTNIATNTTNVAANKDKLDAGLNFGADNGDVINKPVGDGSVLSFTGSENITTTTDGSSIKFDLNGNISVDSIAAGTTVINSSGISMQGGPSMTGQGLNAGDQRLTGVADGVEATDAVNYSQLSALDSRLNSNMNDLGYKIDEVEDDANAGISAAMAMSSLPQAYIIGKSMVGGGIATYNGESAVAIGVSKLSNDGRWVIKVNGTADTQGNVGGAVGAGFHFD
nr:YadA-like family protein [uncultured Psychrobacter sp.]